MKNLKTVPYSKAKRGDLIFYSKSGVVMHIAIYLGHGKIIHSWPGRVQISRANTGRFGYLSKVKRVFISK
jgi:cell wall-associated NlpC family hydrolase